MGRYKYVEVDGKLQLEHRVVWETVHGKKIPKGYCIHHKDGNGRNNDPSNLELLTVGQHNALHKRLQREGIELIDPNDPIISAARIAERKSKARNREQRLKWHRAYNAEHRDEINAKNKAYKEANAELVKERNRKYRETHREERKACNERYDAEHREERSAYARERYLQKKDVIAEQHRVYRETHQAERAAYNKRYKQEHRELVRAKGRLYMAKKRGSNPEIIAMHQAEVDRLSALEKSKPK